MIQTVIFFLFLIFVVIADVILYINSVKSYTNKIAELENENLELIAKNDSLKNRIERESAETESLAVAFSYDNEEILKVVRSIKTSYVISNKSKVTLMKMLIHYLLAFQSSIRLEDLKVNKNGISQNAKIVENSIINAEKVESNGDIPNITQEVNALLSLILYK